MYICVRLCHVSFDTCHFRGPGVLKLVQALNSLVGTVLALAIIGLVAAGGWFAYRNYYAAKFSLEADLAAKQEQVDRLAGQLTASRQQVNRLADDVRTKAAEIVSLNKDLEEKRKEIQRLATALKLMKVDQRLARITVLSQEGSAEKGSLVTRFSFVDVDQAGKPLGEPRIFSVAGDLAYIDSWVVKFGDEYIEEGDPLRATSVALFRRVFGEKQLPSEGFPLDEEGGSRRSTAPAARCRISKKNSGPASGTMPTIRNWPRRRGCGPPTARPLRSNCAPARAIGSSCGPRVESRSCPKPRRRRRRLRHCIEPPRSPAGRQRSRIAAKESARQSDCVGVVSPGSDG